MGIHLTVPSECYAMSTSIRGSRCVCVLMLWTKAALALAGLRIQRVNNGLTNHKYILSSMSKAVYLGPLV